MSGKPKVGTNMLYGDASIVPTHDTSNISKTTCILQIPRYQHPVLECTRFPPELSHCTSYTAAHNLSHHPHASGFPSQQPKIFDARPGRLGRHNPDRQSRIKNRLLPYPLHQAIFTFDSTRRKLYVPSAEALYFRDGKVGNVEARLTKAHARRAAFTHELGSHHVEIEYREA